jgi:TonB-dependent SusC/RagA subfamily outer membrane receptor
MNNIAVAIGLTFCVTSVARAQQKPLCINPDDIEHIEILKGAAAVAAYGGTAGNGVIIIRTKVPSTQVLSNPCGPSAPGDDPFARYLFPPELVMSNQQTINLTDRQRTAIQDAMKEAQGKFLDLQFKMSGEGEKLQRLLQGSTIDESKLLEQVDRVLTFERDIKHAQLTLMARIKNQLTEQQQVELRRRSTSRTGAERPDDATATSPRAPLGS